MLFGVPERFPSSVSSGKEHCNFHNLVESGTCGFRWKRQVTDSAKSPVFHGLYASFSPESGSSLSSGSSAPGVRNILDVFQVHEPPPCRTPTKLRALRAGCSPLPEDGGAVFWAAAQVAVVRLNHLGLEGDRMTSTHRHYLSARKEPFRILLFD